MALTVKELTKLLSVFPDDWEVHFSNDDLTFYRFKDRGGFVHVEFNELTRRVNEFTTEAYEP